jgi:integrase
MTSIPTEQFERDIAVIYRGQDKSPKTIRQFAQVLRELRAVGIIETGQFTDTAIATWIAAWPNRTPETFRSHLRSFAVLCKRAKKKGFSSENPFESDGVNEWMRSDSRPSPPRRRFSKPADAIRGMLVLSSEEAKSGTWLTGRTEAYSHTLFLTGARPGEIQRLRLCDFHQDKMEIEIVAHSITRKSGDPVWWKPKTEGSAGRIPIGRKLTEILAAWSRRVKCDTRRGRLRIRDCEYLFPGEMGWGPWTGGPPGSRPLDVIRALGERAGIRDLTQKAARKGIATYRDIGLTPRGLRDLFRHADEQTGDLYDERETESRRADADRIERFFFGT